MERSASGPAKLRRLLIRAGLVIAQLISNLELIHENMYIEKRFDVFALLFAGRRCFS